MNKLIAKVLVPVALLGAQSVLADFTTTFTDPCDNCSAFTSSGNPQYYGGDGTQAGINVIGQAKPIRLTFKNPCSTSSA